MKLFLLAFILMSFQAKASNWVALDEKLKPQEFDHNITTESNKIAQKCFGFEGACTIDSLKLKLELTFEGIRLPLPHFNIIENAGWGKRVYYIGIRHLRISDDRDKVLGEFKQRMWMESEYSDFTQLIFFDLPNKRIMMSAREYLQGIRDIGYPIKF